jgi:hypothetical protein
MTVKRADEFLRLSQRELHSSLNTLKSEYVVTIREFAEQAKEELFKALRDEIKHLDSRLQPELREEIVRTCLSGLQYTKLIVLIALSADIEFQSIPNRSVAFQQLRKMINARRYTPRAIFNAIKEMLARVYQLDMDVTYNLYKDEIINPWIRSLQEEGEKSLIRNIELSSTVAEELVTSALDREDKRYNRELDTKYKPMDPRAVQHLITIYGNLMAAEAALGELLVHIKEKAWSR